MAKEVTHALSIDVEDYRQILSARFGKGRVPVGDGFVRDMDAVLALLDETSTRATLFVMGTVAEERPDLVRQWADLGHEIASHGVSHRPIWSLSAESLREELLRARLATEHAAGRPVRGYRAPIFSIRWDTLWALDVVAACGFAWDSSIVPVRTRRYGVAGFDRAPAKYTLASGAQIVEVPLAVGCVWGRPVPMGGGGYFRLFRSRRILDAVRQYEARGMPFVAYGHPDELGGQRFSSSGVAEGAVNRLRAGWIAVRSNIGRRRGREAFRAILTEFRFSTLGSIAEGVMAHGAAKVLGRAR